MDLNHLKQIFSPIIGAGLQAVMEGLIRDNQAGSLAETRSFARERRYRRSTDLAAKHRAKTRQWPIIDPEVAHYLYIRFSSVTKFLQIEPLWPVLNAPETRVLSWLLVDNWRRSGHSNWVRGTFGEFFVLRQILGRVILSAPA
jgi:hypothetical protein